jgi:hypothetical protein
MATTKSENYVIDEVIVEDSVWLNKVLFLYEIDYLFSLSEFIKLDIFQQMKKWRLKK